MVSVATSLNSSRSVFHRLKESGRERKFSSYLHRGRFTPGLAGVCTSGCISIKRERRERWRDGGREEGGKSRKLNFRAAAAPRSYSHLYSLFNISQSSTITPGFSVSASVSMAVFLPELFLLGWCCFLSASSSSVTEDGEDSEDKLPHVNISDVSGDARSRGHVTGLTPAWI